MGIKVHMYLMHSRYKGSLQWHCMRFCRMP